MLPFKPLRYTLLLSMGLALLLWGGTSLSSYLRTGLRMTGSKMRSMVPTDFEIERLAHLIQDLDQTISEQRSRLIAQQVDYEYLQRDLSSAKQHEQNLAEEVRSARLLLSNPQEQYRISGQRLSHDRVVAEAQSKAEALLRARSIRESKESTLGALGEALARAETHIESAERQRQNYALRLSELRANAQHVAMRKELASHLGNLPDRFDRGAFQRVEETFARIEREIRIQDRQLNHSDTSNSGERLSFLEAPPQDILELLDSALDTRVIARPHVP